MNLRSFRQPRTESHALRGHGDVDGWMDGAAGITRGSQDPWGAPRITPGSKELRGRSSWEHRGQPEQPESGLEVFFLKLPACQNLWFAQCRAMEHRPKSVNCGPGPTSKRFRAYPESLPGKRIWMDVRSGLLGYGGCRVYLQSNIEGRAQ